MRIIRRILRLVFLLLLIPVVLLLGCQSRLMYFPNPYHAGYVRELEAHRGQRIEYQTSQGKQMAFYVPPRQGAATPRKVWLCFAGNGSLALDWLGFLASWDADFGYLLIDYPSYGDCEGKPTPGRIRESSVAAARALETKLGLTKEALHPRLGVLGHSIGCAAGLMAADDLDVRSVVLVSPFTSMTDMGRRVVGWPLCYLNLHPFDNRRHLKNICDRGVKVTVFHGTEDEVIPVAMSRELAAAHAGCVTLREMPGMHHNDIVSEAAGDIGLALRHASL